MVKLGARVSVAGLLTFGTLTSLFSKIGAFGPVLCSCRFSRFAEPAGHWQAVVRRAVWEMK